MTALPDLNLLPLPDLFAELSGGGLVRRLLELARDEDLGVLAGATRAGTHADITTDSLGEPGQMVSAKMVARGAGVVAGLAAVPMVIEAFGGGCEFDPLARDGEPMRARQSLGIINGPRRRVLMIERTMLNLVSRLSGVATLTARFVEAIRAASPHSPARMYDTRKTTPGLRVLEKYAVRCGGGMCHRLGLFDAVLVKDNHLAAVPLEELAAVIEGVANSARRSRALRFVEVEVDSLEQLDRLLTLPAGVVDIVLLDNMNVEQMREAVRRRDASPGRPQLEASGGITLETVGVIAGTGIDRISAGSLTHQAVSVDIGLDIPR